MIKIYKEKIINLNKGDVYRCISMDSKGFESFGEAYFSFINYDEIKGWKKHTIMTMNLLVPIGKVKFVFFNQNSGRYKSIVIGKNFYRRITVPPNIWFAFKGLEKKENLILNVSNIKVSQNNETQESEIDNFDYNWK